MQSAVTTGVRIFRGFFALCDLRDCPGPRDDLLNSGPGLLLGVPENN